MLPCLLRPPCPRPPAKPPVSESSPGPGVRRTEGSTPFRSGWAVGVPLRGQGCAANPGGGPSRAVASDSASGSASAGGAAVTADTADTGGPPRFGPEAWRCQNQSRGGGEGTDAGPGSRAPGTECAGRSSGPAHHCAQPHPVGDPLAHRSLIPHPGRVSTA